MHLHLIQIIGKSQPIGNYLLVISTVQQCCKPGILAALKGMFEKLVTCERALTEFTHKQCSRFPRFYFLSAKDVFHISVTVRLLITSNLNFIILKLMLIMY